MEREHRFAPQTADEKSDDNPQYRRVPTEEIRPPRAKQERKPRFPNTPEWQALKKKLNSPKPENDSKKTA